MAMGNSADRGDYTFSQVEQSPFYAGASSVPAYSYQVPRQSHPAVNAQSLYSTASYDGRTRRDSTSSSNYTFASSNDTTIPHYPPPPRPLPYGLPYELPCEFGFMGCQIRYPPSDFENWVGHSITHFTGANVRPPSRAICTFCDEDDGIFENERNPESNWRRRMRHIAGHFARLQPEEQLRPDFGVIEHLRRSLSPEDYERAIAYTERPGGLRGIGQRRPATNAHERGEGQGGVRVTHNPRREDRERRRHR